ncbi:hypothetical protein [Cognatiyoonia sp. IB215182]|uniref:hypothetical protein n=1 Tax=Cognatiyoonia sp. IB215182 TaxID=3097353 RepID=UPI002A16F395|nr:hypothetical protein [Cognatiyoonia sp. IB215182]MDX8355193.1 hypothetical protein [Cognatiyoonia sp. IB215182]
MSVISQCIQLHAEILPSEDLFSAMPTNGHSRAHVSALLSTCCWLDQLARENPAMPDGCNAMMSDEQTLFVDDDAIALARLPELVEWLERTAYALVRDGDAKTGNALFVAVAAAEKAVEARSRGENTDLSSPTERITPGS